MRFLVIGLTFVATSFVSCGQSRQDKIEVIIKKMNLVENQKMNYKYQLESLKSQDQGAYHELKELLSDDEMMKIISSALDEGLKTKEINDIYEFVQSSAFEKLFGSGENEHVIDFESEKGFNPDEKNYLEDFFQSSTFERFFESDEIEDIIDSKFEDIDKKIEAITENLDKTYRGSINTFDPIPVDRENGFYATVDYDYTAPEKDIKLNDKPSLTPKDILEAKKVFNSYNDRPEISIVFTEEGAEKFYLLTKENIGKPIAIVIANQIISMPTVTSEIIEGKAVISGNFSEKEIDKIIEILQEK